MRIRGRVRNGVVILEDGQSLPEGVNVTVSCGIAPVSKPRRKTTHVKFPLVHSKHSGSLHLTEHRIAEILDEDDASPRR